MTNSASSQKSGRFALIEQFLADGLTAMFGNPGTVEQGFLDALGSYPQMRYYLTLHETIAVLMADGYARATRNPALVQIHSTPGLGNAIGALYQACRGHSPLIVIGGDAGIRYQNMDAQMAGDLVSMARPVTKWSTMVMDPASLLRVIRRAVKIAATPPRGPVYVCLPMDVLDAPCLDTVRPTVIPSTSVVPDMALIRQAAQWLALASHPMVYVGDGIAASSAQDEVAAVAEMIGGEVWDVDSGEVNIAHSHPLYRGATGHMFGAHSRPILQSGDVNLVCGTYMMPEVFPELGDIFRADAKVIHFDANAYEIAKNHPITVGAVCDPKRTLHLLKDQLAEVMTAEQKLAATRRCAVIVAEKQQRSITERAQDQSRRDRVPLTMSRFMEELSAALPGNAAVFDEALTNSPPVQRYFSADMPGSYFLTRGGSLGVGIPSALGIQAAQRDRTVIAIVGDGAAMYTIQALWTAVRHRLPTKIVICNNGSYRLLQANILAYWQERTIAAHDYPLCFDLSAPPLRFDAMARAQGVESARVEQPSEIGPAIRNMFVHDGPFLLDLVLEGDVHPEMIGIHCGQ